MSIIEIAKLAGVSHTTVSRVMNNEGNVSSETAKKVRAAMKELGYVPKPPAMRRGPRRAKDIDFKTGNIAFLTSSESLQILSKSPVMLDVLNGIEESLAGHGMSLIQGAISSKRPLPPIVARGDVDGVIIWPNLDGVSDETVEILRGFKVVYVMTAVEERLAGDRVQNNNRQIGRLAAKYLHEKGHAKVGYITPTAHTLQHNLCNRWAAFSNYVSQHKMEAFHVEVELSAMDLLDADFHKDASILDQIKVLFADDKLPSGLFVTCDSLTAKLYPILKSIGIQPGRDIDIISCNNEVSLLAGLEPKPAIIDIQAEQIGKKAVEQLRWRISHPDDEDQITIEVQPKMLK